MHPERQIYFSLYVDFKDLFLFHQAFYVFRTVCGLFVSTSTLVVFNLLCFLFIEGLLLNVLPPVYSFLFLYAFMGWLFI